MLETQPDRLETPFGALYKPQSAGILVVSVLASFGGSILLGTVVCLSIGGLSENARIAHHVPYPLIFILGYSLWAARLKALAFEFVGRGILIALFRIVLLRKKPAGIEDVIPDREKLTEMAVRAQKASSSFIIVSFPIGLFAIILSAFCKAESSLAFRTVLLSGSCLAWGAILFRLGRKGYLPFAEDGA
ncbi:MAG TPA: hypothetical protein PL033_13465 [Candidatus Brocadiia bacterium]|nr:hypothetical protein [Candidatus Brocadiia bacterium]